MVISKKAGFYFKVSFRVCRLASEPPDTNQTRGPAENLSVLFAVALVPYTWAVEVQSPRTTLYAYLACQKTGGKPALLNEGEFNRWWAYAVTLAEIGGLPQGAKRDS